MVLGVRGLDFSDGNQRRIARFAFAERVVDRPHLDVTLRPELYASSNTRLDAPYFNPQSDRSAALAVDIEHVIWRFYDRSFGQRLVLTGGAYWQENYGTGAIGAARYEQVWRNDPWTEVRYGVEVNRRIYDGAARERLRPVRQPGAAVLTMRTLARPRPSPPSPSPPRAAASAQDGQRFAAIAYHDVVDRAEDLDNDAVTTARLLAFFDWIRANGWTPVSLDDIAAAERGEQAAARRARC